MDIFFKNILKDLSLNADYSFSFWLIATYCGMYAMWGILLGWWIARLPKQIDARAEEIKWQVNNSPHLNFTNRKEYANKKNKSSWIFILFTLAFITCIFFKSNINAHQKVLYVVLRTAAVLLAWFIFMQPLLMFFFKRYVNKKGNTKKFKVVKLIASLPAIKTFAQQSYYLSGLTP